MKGKMPPKDGKHKMPGGGHMMADKDMPMGRGEYAGKKAAPRKAKKGK